MAVARLMIETALPIPFACSSAVAIPLGTICKMTDLMTAEASAAKEDVVAGICAEEKIAGDGRATVPIYTRGYFKVTISGSVTTGDCLITSADGNQVETGGAAVEDIFGRAQEDATDEQTAIVELNPITINQA